MSNLNNILEHIKTHVDALPAAQRQVAAAILADPEWALRANVETLADRAQVSPPTIIRFCHAIGLEGLREFKLQLAQQLAMGTPFLHRAVEKDDDVLTLGQKIMRGMISSLVDLEQRLDAALLESAISTLANARRLDCYGVGNTSMFMANDAQARFFRLGLTTNAYFDAHMQLISAATLTPDDAVLAISHVGRMPSLLEVVEVARERGATVLAMTQPGTPLAELAHIPLTVSVPEDAVVRVGTEAYLAHMSMLEILMVGVGLRRGNAAIERLRMFHQVLHERGIDSEQHPAMHLGWSKAERNALNTGIAGETDE
jgi:RpiR family carbohydrate utilization transcriptional regulator